MNQFLLTLWQGIAFLLLVAIIVWGMLQWWRGQKLYRTHYHAGGRTIPMDYWTAREYANIFGGQVVRYGYWDIYRR